MSRHEQPMPNDTDDTCDRCGGEGVIEYADAADVWGEDSPSEENHLIDCPNCQGSGRVKA